MTHKIISFSIITAALTLTGGIAHASQDQSPTEAKPVVKIASQKSIVSIPMDTRFTAKDAPENIRYDFETFKTDNVNSVQYDLSEDFDANFGLVKTNNVKRRYKAKSATQPHGRYQRRVNSVLGAGISTKF